MVAATLVIKNTTYSLIVNHQIDKPRRTTSCPAAPRPGGRRTAAEGSEAAARIAVCHPSERGAAAARVAPAEAVSFKRNETRQQEAAWHAAPAEDVSYDRASSVTAEVASSSSSSGDPHIHVEPSGKPCRGTASAPTTAYLRNIPCYFDTHKLASLLDSYGYRRRYDFLYLPMDFVSELSMGYAFVNFRDGCTAEAFRAEFDGFRSWPVPSCKVLSVTWSHSQGFARNVRNLRSTRIPEKFKPLILQLPL